MMKVVLCENHDCRYCEKRTASKRYYGCCTRASILIGDSDRRCLRYDTSAENREEQENETV